MLEQILNALDLDPDEIKIYLHLVQGGPATAGELARKLGMVRPTLYDWLKRMRDKGVVLQTIKRGVRTFQAEAPRRLDQLLQNKIVTLQSQKDKFQQIIPVLEKKLSQFSMAPRFQIFEGVTDVKNVLNDLFLYQDIDIYNFWPIKSAMELLTPEWHENYNRQRIRNRIYTYAIWPKDQIVSFKRHPYQGSSKSMYREIRVAPSTVEWVMGYSIYANKIAFLSSKRECYGMLIESADFAEMMKAQHRILWNLSQPLSSDPADTRKFEATI